MHHLRAVHYQKLNRLGKIEKETPEAVSNLLNAKGVR